MKAGSHCSRSWKGCVLQAGSLLLLFVVPDRVRSQERWTATLEGAPIRTVDGEHFKGLARSASGAPGYLAFDQMQFPAYVERNGKASLLGREGRGPGEFEHFTFAGFIEDTLVTYDLRLSRFTFFTRDRKVVRIEAYRGLMPGGDYFVELTHVLGNGMLLAGVFVDLTGQQVEAAREKNPFVTFRHVYVRLRRNTDKLGLPAMADTIGAINYQSEAFHLRKGKVWATLGGSVRPWGIRQPWADGDTMAVSPNGKWIVFLRRALTEKKRGSLRIVYTGPGQRTVREISLPYAPETITDEMVDSWLAQTAVRDAIQSFVETHKELGSSGDVVALVRKALYRPPYAPVAHALQVSNDGNVWLLRKETSTNTTWDIVGSAGRIDATIDLPTGTYPTAIDGDLIWAVRAHSEEGVELVRLRVRRPAR
jgi:hypothetical protein